MKTGKKFGLISEDLHSSKGSPISLALMAKVFQIHLCFQCFHQPQYDPGDWLSPSVRSKINVCTFRTHLCSVDFLGLYFLNILMFPSPWCVQAEPMVFFQSSCQIYWKNGKAFIYFFLVNCSIKWLKIRYFQPSGKPWHLVSNIKHFCHDSTNFTGIQLSCLKSVGTSE